MKKPEVTEWFHPSVKPKHIGVYERSPTGLNENDDAGWFTKWDGQVWCKTYMYIKPASKCTEKGIFQDWYWRGLRKNDNE